MNDEDSGLLGCYIVSTVNYLPKFRRSICLYLMRFFKMYAIP